MSDTFNSHLPVFVVDFVVRHFVHSFQLLFAFVLAEQVENSVNMGHFSSFLSFCLHPFITITLYINTDTFHRILPSIIGKLSVYLNKF